MNSARPSTLGWCLKRQQVLRLQPRARGLEMRRRHAGRELTRRSMTVTAEHSRKNFSPGTPSTLQISCGSQIAVVVPRGTHAASNSSGGTRLDSQWTWRVDEARHGDEPAAVDLGGALVGLVRADDAVAGDGDVTHRHVARGQVEDADRLDHQIGRRLAARLIDDVGETRYAEGVSHQKEIRRPLCHGNGIGLAMPPGNATSARDCHQGGDRQQSSD